MTHWWRTDAQGHHWRPQGGGLGGNRRLRRGAGLRVSGAWRRGFGRRGGGLRLGCTGCHWSWRRRLCGGRSRCCHDVLVPLRRGPEDDAANQAHLHCRQQHQDAQGQALCPGGSRAWREGLRSRGGRHETRQARGDRNVTAWALQCLACRADFFRGSRPGFRTQDQCQKSPPGPALQVPGVVAVEC